MNKNLLHLGWSVVARAQRREIASIAEKAGVRAIFLKAAWADEILYGGEGARHGADIDVFCPGAAFRKLAVALQQAGYERKIVKGYRATSDLGDKEWSFAAAHGGLPLDLHRALSEHYRSCTLPFARRAKTYSTADGDAICSLDEEDQILFCAIHHVNHGFDLDGRHLNDIAELVRAREIDWQAVKKRSRQHGLQVPMALMFESLEGRGARVPEPNSFLDSHYQRITFRWAKGWVETSPGLKRKDRHGTGEQYLDMLYRLPRLTGRPLVPPWLLLRYVLLRGLDKAAWVVGR